MTEPARSTGGGQERVDVVVVGASLAGCTAATLLGRAGLRVALLEKHRSADTAKALCGHFILAGTQPTLRRLGLRDRMLALGAVEDPLRFHTGSWAAPHGSDLPRPISLRRSKLDPLVREMAAATTGVELHLGHPVGRLLHDGGRVVGVTARTPSGRERTFRARLVVGADGSRSRVAALAGVDGDELPNGRFGVFAYYEGVEHAALRTSQVWSGVDVAISTPTDDGLTLLAAFMARGATGVFRADPAAALERFLSAQPDAPDLRGARRVSAVLQAWDHRQVRRPLTPLPGLALIGDAATTGDPTPAVGCGWAFRSAEMLADAAAPALLGAGDPDRALAGYRRAHRFIDRHDDLCRAESRALPPDPVERIVLASLALDPAMARAAYRLRMRIASVGEVRNPVTLARAAVAVLRRRPPRARMAGSGRPVPTG